MAAQVIIREGVLWVGGEAYPLRNIAHVGQRYIAVDKGAQWKQFIFRSVLCCFVALIVSVAASSAGMIVFLIGEAFLVWKLVSVLKLPVVYGLVLNTAGTQRDAIWSTSHEEIQHLIAEVTKAIGHPDVAQTVINVAHAVKGDIIQQVGANSIGKAGHSGSGNIGGS